MKFFKRFFHRPTAIELFEKKIELYEAQKARLKRLQDEVRKCRLAIACLPPAHQAAMADTVATIDKLFFEESKRLENLDDCIRESRSILNIMKALKAIEAEL